MKGRFWKCGLAVLLLTAAVLSGCSGKKTEQVQAGSGGSSLDYLNATGYPIVKSPITITVTGDKDATPDWNATDFVDQVEKQFGIKMDCSPFDREAWATQFTLLLSSGDLPDLILNLNQPVSTVNEYGAEGFFLPINEYLQYMPSLAATFEKYPDYKSLLSDGEGNIYGLSRINMNLIGLVNRSFINKIWLDNVKLGNPKTLDELYTVLKAFKEKDANGNGNPNDEIPMSSDGVMAPILQAFGIFTNTPSGYTPILRDGKVVLSNTTDEYKAFLKYMNRLFKEGLYDKDALIQTTEEFRAKARDDRFGVYSTGGAPFVEAGKDISYDKDFYFVGGLTSEYNKTPTVVYNSSFTTNVLVTINKDTKYPEAICRLLDWLYDENGHISGSRGFENVSWDYQTFDYAPDYPIVTVRTVDGYNSIEEYRYKKAVINNATQLVSVVSGTSYGMLIDANEKLLDDERVLTDYGWAVLIEKGRRLYERADNFPILVYTAEESRERATLVTDLNLYLSQALTQFISGEIDIDAGWNNYLRTLEQVKAARLVAIDQAAYDRMYK
jgi:putative aldouronate transport system substrate-binding protein